MHTHHFGSSICSPCPSSLPDGIYTLHFSTRAHILNPFAMGPNVPAISGQAVDANHHRLCASQSAYSSKDHSNGLTWVLESPALPLQLDPRHPVPDSSPHPARPVAPARQVRGRSSLYALDVKRGIPERMIEGSQGARRHAVSTGRGRPRAWAWTCEEMTSLWRTLGRWWLVDGPRQGFVMCIGESADSFGAYRIF
jgi:hypothetical protein